MKIAHFSLWAPRRSGLYEATRDLIKYERRLGLESEFLESEVRDPDPAKFSDDWLTARPWSWAGDADVLVLHRAIPQEFHAKRPQVVVMHGPAEIFLLEDMARPENAGFNFNVNLVWDHEAAVAVTPQDYQIMRQYDEKDRLRFIEDAVDLERYSLEGPKWDYQHHPAIVSADTFRLNKPPFHIVLAMEQVRKRIPGARLNFFGIPLAESQQWRSFFVRARHRRHEASCEMLQLMVPDLRPFVRGADISFNSNLHGLHSRASAMEALAMGLPVVAYSGAEDYTPYVARTWCLDSIAEAIDRCWRDIQARGRDEVARECRAMAEQRFDMARAAMQFRSLYEEALGR